MITDIITNNLAWFLVSDEFQKMARNLNLENVQFISVDILETSSETMIEGYAALNVIGHQDVIDYSHSIFYETQTQDGRIEREVVKFALVRDRLRGFDFIRPKGNPGALIVSERVKKIFGKRSVTGAGFREIRTY